MDKTIKYLNAGVVSIASGLLVALIGFMTVAVLFRYALNAPLVFADEIPEYLFLGVNFLGLAYAMQMQRHIRVVVVLERLPAKLKRPLTQTVLVIFLIYVLLLLVGIICLVWSYFVMGTKSSSILRTPLVWPALLMPIGVLTLVLEVIREIYRRSP